MVRKGDGWLVPRKAVVRKTALGRLQLPAMPCVGHAAVYTDDAAADKSGRLRQQIDRGRGQLGLGAKTLRRHLGAQTARQLAVLLVVRVDAA